MKATIDPRCKRWAACAAAFMLVSCGGSSNPNTAVPDVIMQIMQKPAYNGATWAIRSGREAMTGTRTSTTNHVPIPDQLHSSDGSSRGENRTIARSSA